MRTEEQRLVDVVQHLGPLAERVVFVGGAILCVLLPDRSARVTNDVDIVVSADSVTEYELVVARELRRLGWREDDRDSAPRCRWLHPTAGVLDAMTSDARVFGFSNRWYAGALAHAQLHRVGATVLRIATVPYFFATKIEAYNDRGGGDFASSHDIEDILAVLTGKADPVDLIAAADPTVRAFIVTTFRHWLEPTGAMPPAFPGKPGGGLSLVEEYGRFHFEGGDEGDRLAELAIARLVAIAALSVE